MLDNKAFFLEWGDASLVASFVFSYASDNGQNEQIRTNNYIIGFS